MVAIHRPKQQRAVQNSAYRLGEPVTHDMQMNCLSCVRWSFCKDPKRGFNYRCSRYNENSIDTTSVEDTKLKDWLKTDLSDLETLDVIQDSEADQRIDEIISQAIAENSPIPPDIKLKDREIPLAKNFHEWLIDERFTGGGMPPFARQIYVGSLLFAEHCPRCSDIYWFDHMKVDVSLSKLQSKVVFLEHGVCPECQVTRGELVDNGELADPFDLVLIAGQRSSKTSSINLMDTYNTHRYLKLPNPARIYRQLPQQVFTSTYTSNTFGQVRQNLWEPFLNIVNGSNWYNNYHKFLMRRGQELGEELFTIADIYVRYRHRNLFLSPASPNGQTMRGRTRYAAIIDEVSHMPLQRAGGKDAVRANAKDTYTALRNSLDTLIQAYQKRFAEGYFDLPKPLMYNASSPATLNDYGMTLLRMSKASKSMLGLKYPTWKFNPNLPRSFFDDHFRVKPVEAARDFGCEPPLGQATWMTDTETIASAFGDRRNAYDIKTYTRRSKSRKLVTAANLIKRYNPNLRWGCLLTLDVGAVNNSFAFAVSTIPNDFELEDYLEEDPDAEESETVLVPIKTLFVGEVIPTQDAEISQTLLYSDVLGKLCEDLPIIAVASDRWQNKKIVQDLEDRFEIDYYEWRLGWEDFENFRAGMFDQQIELPKLNGDLSDIMGTTLEDYPNMFRNKPIEHLAYQFLTVQEVRGKSVVKGDATDDMFRCVALAHSVMQDVEILEDFIVEEEMPERQGNLGLVYSRSKAAGIAVGNRTLTPSGTASPVAMTYKGVKR